MVEDYRCIFTLIFVSPLSYLHLLIHVLSVSVREQLKDLTKQYDKSENDLKALQSVGQIVGEVLKQLTEEKCGYLVNILQYETAVLIAP